MGVGFQKLSVSKFDKDTTMGLNFMSSSSTFDVCMESAKPKLPNPDPAKFKIMQHRQYDNYLIIKINYPDCNNFEGNKILVYEDCDIIRLASQKLIDPHFSNNPSYHSPIARFLPTAKGWRMAVSFVDSMLTKDSE